MTQDGSAHSLFGTLSDLPGAGAGQYYSLPKLEEAGLGQISRLPVCLRIVLESVLRNYDGERITEEDVRTLAGWQAGAKRTEEIPFVVARVLLQDLTGVPLLVDLAAMRSKVAALGKDPTLIEPLVPVDLVVDHSIQVDVAGVSHALTRNMEIEFQRNRERYEFLKWGMQAFDTFKVIPPGIGICHQVNLEYLASGVLEKNGIYYPDTLVGTDSHTTMINGLGVVGWGVGGIEAEAGMLGQPIYFLTPDVVGVHLKGRLPQGATATDLVLRVTEVLRETKVVGKFVEFFGEGAAELSLQDRATISNMAPEYGATMGFFPVDEQTCTYLEATGREKAQIDRVRNYFTAQGLFGIPQEGDCDYSQVVELDLANITPAVAGPRRPQDRIEIGALKGRFDELLGAPLTDGGWDKPEAERGETWPIELNGADASLRDGDVVIAAITSCTNTSNPSVMLAAGLVAKKAVERGLSVRPIVKASLAPGSRVVSDYLEKTGLQEHLDALGFDLVGYGCTTCIGNSGPLDSALEQAIDGHNVVAASVLSGNRNFEARVHQKVRANFLASPPLVVAYALAGTVDIDLSQDPIGNDRDGKPVHLTDLWPSSDEIRDCLMTANDPATYRRLYSNFADQNPLWNDVAARTGDVYEWDPKSTYVQNPPFFDDFGPEIAEPHDVHGARALAVFGDSVTTDHISPAGAIKPDAPAGRYLQEKGVPVKEFNSYGSRRGNDRIMTRGTFANVRIKNRMVPGVEGGVTVHQPDGTRMDIYDAAMKYKEEGVPLVVLAGQEYGTGSSRDWAAKGTQILGVKAVIAESFERIHRSNLVFMGVLPCQFNAGTNPESLELDGTETYELSGIEAGISPRMDLKLTIKRANGDTEEHTVQLRIDTPIEVDYYKNRGILPYVLRQLVA